MYLTPKRRGPQLSDVDRNCLKRDLANLHFVVPHSLLWEPTPTDVVNFCQSVVAYVYEEDEDAAMAAGGARADGTELEVHGLDLLSELGNCHRIFSRLRLYRQCQRFYRSIGEEDFMLRDLLHPDPYRVNHFCNAFAQFCKFKEDNAERLRSKKEEILKMNRTMAALNEQLSNSRLEESQLSVIQRDTQTADEEIERRHNMIKEELMVLHSKFSSGCEALSNANASGGKLASELKHVEGLTGAAKSRQDQLECEVVRSPGRLKKSYDQLVQATETEEQNLRQTNRKRQVARKRLELVNRLQRVMNKADHLLARFKAQLERSCQMAAEGRDGAEACRSAEAELAAVREQLRQTTDSCEREQKKLDDLKISTAELFRANEDEVERARRKVEDRKDSLASQRREAEVYEREAVEVEENIQQLEEAGALAVAKCCELQQRIILAAERIADDVNSNMENLAANFREGCALVDNIDGNRHEWQSLATLDLMRSDPLTAGWMSSISSDWHDENKNDVDGYGRNNFRPHGAEVHRDAQHVDPNDDDDRDGIGYSSDEQGAGDENQSPSDAVQFGDREETIGHPKMMARYPQSSSSSSSAKRIGSVGMGVRLRPDGGACKDAGGVSRGGHVLGGVGRRDESFDDRRHYNPEPVDRRRGDAVFDAVENANLTESLLLGGGDSFEHVHYLGGGKLYADTAGKKENENRSQNNGHADVDHLDHVVRRSGVKSRVNPQKYEGPPPAAGSLDDCPSSKMTVRRNQEAGKGGGAAGLEFAKGSSSRLQLAPPPAERQAGARKGIGTSAFQELVEAERRRAYRFEK